MPPATHGGGPALRAGRHVDFQRFLFSWFALPLSLLAALVLGAVMMLALGANPITGYNALIVGRVRWSYALGSTAVEAAPLLLVGRRHLHRVPRQRLQHRR